MRRNTALHAEADRARALTTIMYRSASARRGASSKRVGPHAWPIILLHASNGAVDPAEPTSGSRSIGSFGQSKQELSRSPNKHRRCSRHKEALARSKRMNEACGLLSHRSTSSRGPSPRLESRASQTHQSEDVKRNFFRGDAVAFQNDNGGYVEPDHDPAERTAGKRGAEEEAMNHRGVHVNLPLL